MKKDFNVFYVIGIIVFISFILFIIILPLIGVIGNFNFVNYITQSAIFIIFSFLAGNLTYEILPSQSNCAPLGCSPETTFSYIVYYIILLIIIISITLPFWVIGYLKNKISSIKVR